jgi:hypothetical protein
VHTLQVDGETCELLESTPRCIFFRGFLEGCGIGGGCEVPNEGEMYVRDLDGTVELLFYPYDDICGPLPSASPEEPDWMDCVEPPHAACDCICGEL